MQPKKYSSTYVLFQQNAMIDCVKGIRDGHRFSVFKTNSVLKMMRYEQIFSMSMKSIFSVVGSYLYIIGRRKVHAPKSIFFLTPCNKQGSR